MYEIPSDQFPDQPGDLPYESPALDTYAQSRYAGLDDSEGTVEAAHAAFVDQGEGSVEIPDEPGKSGEEAKTGEHVAKDVCFAPLESGVEETTDATAAPFFDNDTRTETGENPESRDGRRTTVGNPTEGNVAEGVGHAAVGETGRQNVSNDAPAFAPHEDTRTDDLDTTQGDHTTTSETPQRMDNTTDASSETPEQEVDYAEMVDNNGGEASFTLEDGETGMDKNAEETKRTPLDTTDTADQSKPDSSKGGEATNIDPDNANAPTDLELLAQARNSDDPEAASQALGKLFERHYPRVRHIAYRRLGSREAADDVAQTVFMRATMALPALKVPEDGDGNQLARWLGTMARNEAIDEVRRTGGIKGTARHRHRPVKIREDDRAWDDKQPTPEVVVLENIAGEELMETLTETIGEDRAAVVASMYVGGLTMQDTADAMGEPLGTIQSRSIRGRNALKRAILDETIDLGLSPQELEQLRQRQAKTPKT